MTILRHPITVRPALTLLVAAFAGCSASTPAAEHGVIRRARNVSDAEVAAVGRSALLIDTHNDITSRTVLGYDLGDPNKTGETDLARIKAPDGSGAGAIFFAAFVNSSYVPQKKSENRTLQMIDTVRTDIVDKHPEVFEFATTAGDIERARANGKIAALIGIEGGHAIEDSLRLLRTYFALGVRYMTLTHTNTNNWADSSGDIDDPKIEHHNGLTGFGRDVVREMNRLGMMVDISHVSDKTFYDALETSTAPLIATHSGSRAVCGHPRNMTDDMIRKLAARGGVVQVNFGCDFLSETRYRANEAYQKARAADLDAARALADPDARRNALRTIREAADLPPTSVADVVAHIDHIVQIAGISAVGIGTDYDGVPCVPADVSSYSQFPTLTRVLLERGYTANDIRQIYGGNTLRLMRAVEHEAARLQKIEAQSRSTSRRSPAPTGDLLR